MSDVYFPTLPGLAWDTTKTPIFSTATAQAVSGREVSASGRAYPLWEWSLSYEFLRAGAQQELQTLIGFFLARRGKWDSFLFADPTEDNEVEGDEIGTSDGVETTYQCTKTLGGYVEPVNYIDPTTLHVYLTIGGATNEVVSGISLDSKMRIVFDTAPAAGAVITADYTWAYRVRFADDSAEFQNFLFNLWELRSVTFRSFRP